MSPPPAPADTGGILPDALRFINPFVPDKPPPNPPVRVGRRRVCGGAGALGAIAGTASLKEGALQGAIPCWHIVIYGIIVVILIAAGTSMGAALTRRASYKIVFGTLFGTLAVILVGRTILSTITLVW